MMSRRIRRILSCLALLLLFFSGCATYQPFDEEAARTTPVDQPSVVPVMAEAAQKGRTAFISDDKGVRVPVRIYGEEHMAYPVLMLHGLQSHSGWFVQSAAHIASLGIPVYQVDRRGSGLSSEPRGHADSYDDMIKDILTVARYAMKQHGVDKFHLLGHCFGAIPATAFGVRHPELLQSLLICTPAIYTKTGVYFREEVQIVKSELSKNYKYIPIHIDAAQFTESQTYLRFINDDPLALKQVTTHLYFQVPLARHYIKTKMKNLTMPVFMGMAAMDTICDNEENKQFFAEVKSNRKQLIIYDKAKHILEFSDDRDTFFKDLSAWFLTAGMKPVE
ncbi:MAG: alpha/beta fold hydrolase [Thermodesulfobacteriota bacterium]